MGDIPRLMTAGIVACLLFLLAPANANKCIVGCHGMNPSKAYAEGNTYTYDLEGASVTSVSEAQGESSLKLSGVVELAIKPDCVHQLRVKDLRVNGAPVALEDAAKHALQFNYHDGHIDTSVCAEEGDSQASLNIKRAVASLFQSAVIQDSGATTHRETDVFGGCKTDFSFRKEGDKDLVINKHRDLSDCSHRETIKQGLLTATFDPNADVQTSPLLSSHLQTEQRFKDGILNKASSSESYVYRPFSNGDAGAKTTVKLSLTLKGNKPSAGPVSAPTLGKSLIFDPPHPVVASSVDAIVKALTAVKEECPESAVKEHAATKFADLVKVLGVSSKNDILAVYDKVKSGSGGFDKKSDKKILLDALFRTGSGEAAEVAIELIKKGDVSGLEALRYYASLVLVRHVNLATVGSVTSLLDQQSLPRVAYLGIGHVIGKYCDQHECADVPEIKAALGKILSKIEGKLDSRQKENVAIAALKALGNARYHDKPTSDKIAKIASDKKAKNRVRVAAIEALPSTCSPNWKKQLFEVLANREEDSEIRIKSYLALVRCPSADVAKKVKEVLDSEKVNQVGSFITSHLRNLRASTDPNKKDAKYHLSEVKPRIKFPEDFRKFSFNNEISYNIGAFGVGSSAESNVIYSQKSFVPRSASLNLTTELFGHSFNLLELDGRVENLDRLIEHYFGPKGELKTHEVKDLALDGKASLTKLYEKIKERLEKSTRGRRDVRQESLNKFAKKVHLDPGKASDDDLDVDLSIKAFGVELLFLDYQGTGIGHDPSGFIDTIFDIFDRGVNEAKNFNHKIENHVHFLDAELVYPTGLGFPLVLGVTGDAVVHLKASGNVDLPALFKNPESAAVRIALEPSAAISIVGTMVVDGLGKESGIRLQSTLHSATGSDISVKLLDGKGIDVSFGVPKRKQEIISVSSEVLFVSPESPNKLVAPKFTKGKEHADCFDQFSALLGLTVCGHLSYPYESIESVQKKPFFPFSGPGKFALSIENNDVTSYHFKAFYDTKQEKSRSFEITLETPNSKNNRKISFKVDGALEPQKFVKVSLDSPYKQISGEIRLKNTPEEQTLALTANNDVDTYFLRVGAAVESGTKYKPILEYKVPEHIEKLASSKTGTSRGSGKGQLYKVTGDMDVQNIDDGKKYTFNNLVLVAGDRELASLDGFVSASSKEVAVDVKIKQPHADANVAIKVDIKKADKGASLDLLVIPSKNPENGFKVAWHYTKAAELLDHQLVFTYGPDLESKFNRLTITDKLSYKKAEAPTANTPAYLRYATALKAETKVTWPQQGLSHEFDIELTPTSIDTDFDFEYGKFKIGAEVELKVEKEHARDAEFKFKARLLESKIEVKAKRTRLAEHKNKFEGSVELSGGSKYDAVVEITYDVKSQNVNIQVDGELGLNGKKIKVDYGVEATPQKGHSHAILTIDSAKLLDFLLKVHRGANPHGSLNLVVKNILIVGGQFNYQSGKGNANLNIEVPSIHRKIKASGDVSVTGTKHVANVEVLLDADKDPNKRLKLTTDTDLTKESVDSKNSIEVGKYKTEVNVKGTVVNNGKNGFTGEGNAAITLPNNHYIVVHGKHDLVRDGKKNRLVGSYKISDAPEKGGKTAQLAYQTELAWVEGPDHEYIGKHHLTAQSYEGKDVTIDVSASHERLPNSDKRKSELITGLSGSLIPKRFLFALSGNYNNVEGDWKLKSELGNDLGVKGNGKYAKGNLVDVPASSESTIEFKFPSEKLKTLKLESSASVLVPHKEGGLFEWKESRSLTYNGDKNLKAELHARHTGIPDNQHESEGSAKITILLLNNVPLSLSTSYKQDPKNEEKKASGTLNVKYGDKEASLSSELAFYEDLKSVSLDAKATTPIDKFRNIELKVQRKKSPDGPHSFELVLVADDKKYTVSSEVQLSQTLTSVNIVFTCPKGKTALVSKFGTPEENVYTGEWKVDSPYGYVAADGRVKLEGIDSFFIELNFDSDKIKHRKIHAEIATKPAVKAGKRIVVTVTSDGKNIVTGSTNYNKRDEAGKVIVEGNGSLKIGENTRTSKFTYTRKQLTREVDGEVGVAILLNTNFGPSAVVGELKLSNKEVHIFNSYCEQSKDCAHFKLQSAFDTSNLPQVNYQLTVEVDLKKFNVPVEFGLKTNTKYVLKEPVFDHTANLYVHTSKDKTQYSSQVYIHAKDSAIILTLPSREVAIISSYEIPKSRQSGAVKFDVSVYLDRKNKPNDKTSLIASGDINIEKNTAAVSGEAKFSYPSQPKDMIVKGKLHYGGENLLDAHLDLDVFAKKAQKIVINAKLLRAIIPKGYNVTGALEINSKGQQLKVDLKQHLAVSGNELGFGSILSYTDVQQKPRSLGALLSLNAKEAHLLVQAPNKDLIKSDTTIDITKNSQKINTEYTILDNPTVVVSFEANNLNSFSYQSNEKNNPKTKLVANGRVVVGQLAEIHADAFKNGEKKNLFNILIHLDESKFLKTDFAYSKDNIVALIDYYRARGIDLAKQLKEVSSGVGKEAVTELNDLVQHLKKAQPNLKPLADYYQGELEKLKSELHADETIKEIQATLHKVFGGVVVAVTETLKQMAGHFAELNKQLHEIVEKLAEAVKSAYPHLKESFDKLFQIGVEIFDAAAKLGTTYLKAILNVINEHQKEIKQLLGVAAELTQDIAKIIMKGATQIEKEIKDFIVLVIQQIKALPVYEFIKEKYAEFTSFNVPDTILIPIDEAYVQLKKILPTEELKDFFTVTYEYIMKLVKREKVDDAAEIKKIWGSGVDAIQSLIGLVQSRVTFEDLGFSILRIPADISSIKRLPGIATLKLSILNLLQNHELPTPIDAYYAYRPTLHFGDVIPPFSHTGFFLEGGHFFTFDGRHLTLAGTCDYIVAQDMRDGNFSVVANLAAGKLTSVIVTAPGESITIKSNGNILANGKPAEYPVLTKNLDAFLTPPIVNVKSAYGIHLMCTQKSPMSCGLHVSGFYLGKIRGILGDGNNEAYDDFTLPSGHITEDETEFGNAYKLNSGCAAAPAVDHHSHNRNPTCTEYFTGSSSLSPCFNYVDPANFRQACDHATSAGTPQAACLIAKTYWASCLKERVFISIPNNCGSCNVKGDEIGVGDAFSVKLPQKQADVVFVIEQDIKNEKIFKELVQPLINDVKSELKQNGITDIHVGLIGFAEHMNWPQHYTTGGSPNIDGEVTNVKFAPSTPLVTLQEAKEGDAKTRLKYIKQRLDVELGTFKLTDAYEEAVGYPFRTGAAKVVVAVIATPCEKTPLPISLQQLRILMGLKVYRDLGLTYYHVSFLDEILVSGKPQKNVIGYDAESAYTFADSKKKPLEGSSEIKNNLVLTNNDVCAGFAVSSGGAAFNLDNYVDAKPNQKKQFAQVAARRIAEGIVNLEIEEDCVCKLSKGIDPRASCKIVGRKDKDQRHSKA